jgi:molybdopterin-containing oxidoreductase family iron-sulfur binding subunit
LSTFDTVSRRTFLQAAGFTIAAAATPGCSRPPERSRVTHLVQPEVASPGERLQYATTCPGCSAGCGVLASVRDGRPVKLEGLPGHPVSQGGLCAAGQASILGLYDGKRVRQPRLDGKPVSWDRIDARLKTEFAAARGVARVLTGTDAAASPTTRTMIARFLGGFADARHDIYDVLSASAITDAHRATHGARAIPRFRFDRADVVVAFEADFLGTWISPVEFMAAYTRQRPSLHVQVESRMTLTGSKADRRIVVAPGDLGPAMAALVARLASRAGHGVDVPAVLPTGLTAETMDRLAESLWRARGRALVACGSENVQLQRLVNFANELLQSYGSTLDVTRPSRQRLGDDASIARLTRELATGAVGVLVTSGVNPIHELPEGGLWAELLTKVPVWVAVAERVDETAALARYLCPSPHPFESWGDYEPVAGTVCLRQPTTAAVGDTRSLDASLAAWSGTPLAAGELVRARWRDAVFDASTDGPSFEAFWDRSLREGWTRRPNPADAAPRFDVSQVPSSVPATSRALGTLVLMGYPTVALLDGRQAFNPWLLELPDPVTKVTWESGASVSPATARVLGVSDGDLVRIAPAREAEWASKAEADDPTIEVPIVVQPGQHDDVIAVPVGFGQRLTQRFAGLGPRWLGADVSDRARVGANIAPLLARAHPDEGVAPTPVRVSVVGRRRELARTQDHSWLQGSGRDAWGTEASGALIRFAEPSTAPRPIQPETEPGGQDLWPDERQQSGPRWGMAIDLDACTGCSACVVACQVENNTPVVGRDEVRRHREMHWLRIDRYYLEGPSGVAVAHQPMTCHQCGHAPCETVCPVLATTRSSDGLNQQIYSRCVGTRYCMNNCPFKVRRFNWFDYAHDERMENLVLNPDVTVRSRGVAEKCTFCVQRIQDARLAARLRGEELADGDILPACAQTCAASAITFGDLNDPHSRVRARAGDGRAYTLLEGLNLQPAITYLAVQRRDRSPEDDVDGD